MAVDEIGGEHRITAPLVLSIAGTVWYAVIWGMGLVGCIAAYVYSKCNILTSHLLLSVQSKAI